MASFRRDRGAAAVEFALVLPLLLLLLFGIIDFGRMLNAQIILSEAAREGARATALQNSGVGTTRAKAITNNLAGPTAVTVSFAGDCSSPGPSSDTTVTVLYHFKFITPIGIMAGIIGGSNDTVDLKGVGVMPCLH